LAAAEQADATATESAQTLAAATSAALKGQHLALNGLSADTWPLVFAQLKVTGVSRSIASHCSFAGVDAMGLHLVLSTQYGALYNDEHRKRIETALVDYVGEAVKVHITQGQGSSETPAARRLRLEDERKLAAVNDFTSDPLVQALQERFAAEIDFDSITPLTPPQH
jgi:DNA polymerase III subunit gamma/tau